LAIALVLAWFAVAHGQALIDPYVVKDGTYGQRANPDGNSHNNSLFGGDLNAYTGNQGTGDLYRYLQGQRSRDNSNRGSYNYNPYSLYKW